MAISRREWLRRYDAAHAALPSPRIVSCNLTRRWRGGYDVVIIATDVPSLGAGVIFTVGGLPVDNLRPEAGDKIAGSIAGEPVDREVLVDLGPIQAKGVITGIRRLPPGLLPWVRRSLGAVISFVGRWLQGGRGSA